MPPGDPGQQPQQPQGPTPLGLMPGMDGRSPMDGVPIGYPGGSVDADMSRGLDDLDGTRETSPDTPQDDGLPGKRLEELFQQYISTKHDEMTDMHKCELFYHGHHWTEEQISVLRRRKQPPFYWNEIRKKVDSYIGIEQRLRRDPKAYPVTPQHDVDATAITAALRSIDDETNAKLVFSEAGRDFFVRGIGVVWNGVYRTPKGGYKHCKRRVRGRNFIYDPKSTEWDFADAKFMGEYTIMDLEDAEDLFMQLGREDSAKRVRGLIHYSSGDSPDIGLDWSSLGEGWWSRERQTVKLVHLYYRYRNQWRCAYFCGNVKLYDQPSVYQDEDGYSVQPFDAASAYVDSDGTRYGVVRDLIPIQEVINQRYSKLTHMLSTRQLIFGKGAVPDINKARQELHKPDGVIEVNAAESAIDNVFQVKTQDAEIAGNVQLFSQALGMMQNYGPNSALLGKEDSGQQSGRAILARQNAGMTEMSPVFDRHREFKLAAYRRDWDICKQFWTTEKWIRVMDDERGVKFAAFNRQIVDPQTGQIIGVENDIAAMDVDIILEEGPDVIVMQEELLQVLSNVAGASPAMQKILITLSGVPNKDYLLEMIDQANAPPQVDPQTQELAKRMADLEALEKAAGIDKAIANADKYRADAVVDMYKEGLNPALVGDQFPITYRQPTLTEGLMQQLFSQPQQPPMGQMPPGPPNALANDNRPVSPPPPQSAQGPQAMPGQEPQMNQPGGLPMGREFAG
jgi:hypothetical protein